MTDLGNAANYIPFQKFGKGNSELVKYHVSKNLNVSTVKKAT